MKLFKLVQVLLGIIWQLPQSIVGGIIFIFLVIKAKRVESWQGRLLVHVFKKYGGLSLGYFIYVNLISSPDLLKHEYGHSLQSLILGPLYLIVIGIPSFLWACFFQLFLKKSKVSYFSFYTESWADKLGGVVRQ